MKNRIQIVNWRKHGQDESYVRLEVFGEADLHPAAESRHSVGCADADLVDVIEFEDKLDRHAEDRGDYEKMFYVNDDLVIEDGQVLTGYFGLRYRVNITMLQE